MSLAKVKIVLVVLPFANKITYARVKYWGDVKAGIHSVCVLQDNLKKGHNYYANVALKFNLKMGGVNQLLPSHLGFLNQGTTMVVGIDVSHPPPKSMEETPSIAAVVASIDNEYGQWPGSVRCQGSKQEMVSTLQVMMEERLRAWIRKNERRPAKILTSVMVSLRGSTERCLTRSWGVFGKLARRSTGPTLCRRSPLLLSIKDTILVSTQRRLRLPIIKAIPRMVRWSTEELRWKEDVGIFVFLPLWCNVTSRRHGASDLCYGLASVFATLDRERKCLLHATRFFPPGTQCHPRHGKTFALRRDS